MTYGYQSLASFVSASVKLLHISLGPPSALHAGLEMLPSWVAQSQPWAGGCRVVRACLDIACARHASAFHDFLFLNC